MPKYLPQNLLFVILIICQIPLLASPCIKNNSENSELNTLSNSPKTHKHHHPYNRCPIKRGVDRKLKDGYYYGTASFYHSKFNGRKTSNGERFSSKKMTCAHKSLRLGTYLEVTNLSNHRKIYVKVNDRLPPHSCRMIDLSRMAATKLHMVRQGLVRVKIKVIPKALGIQKKQEELAVK